MSCYYKFIFHKYEIVFESLYLKILSLNSDLFLRNARNKVRIVR